MFTQNAAAPSGPLEQEISDLSERAIISVFDKDGKLGEQADLIGAMVKIRLAKETNQCLESVTVQTKWKQSQQSAQTTAASSQLLISGFGGSGS